MKSALRIASWIALVVSIGVLASRWVQLHKMEGQSVVLASSREPGTLEHTLAEPRAKILIFWASWCGPCTVELARFASAVRDGEIAADRVIAVSTDEDPQAYEQAAKKRGYPFKTFLDRAGLARRLGVQMTPTLMHVGPDGRVEYATAGLSLVGTWRARWFLRGSNDGR